MIAKEYHILDEVDKELLRLKLEKPTISYSVLAEKIGMSLQHVFKRCKDETFQKALAEYQKHAIDIVRDAKQKAARKLVKLVDSSDERVSLQTCLALCADVLPGAKFNVAHSGAINIISGIPRPELSKATVAEDGSLEGDTIDILELAKKANGHNGNGVH